LRKTGGERKRETSIKIAGENARKKKVAKGGKVFSKWGKRRTKEYRERGPEGKEKTHKKRARHKIPAAGSVHGGDGHQN